MEPGLASIPRAAVLVAPVVRSGPPVDTKPEQGPLTAYAPGEDDEKKRVTMGADGPLAPCCWPSRGPAWGNGEVATHPGKEA